MILVSLRYYQPRLNYCFSSAQFHCCFQQQWQILKPKQLLWQPFPIFRVAENVFCIYPNWPFRIEVYTILHHREIWLFGQWFYIPQLGRNSITEAGEIPFQCGVFLFISFKAGVNCLILSCVQSCMKAGTVVFHMEIFRFSGVVIDAQFPEHHMEIPFQNRRICIFTFGLWLSESPCLRQRHFCQLF